MRRSHLYCSRCGSRLVRRHVDGRTRPACGSCGHVIYDHLKVGAGLMVEREGMLLLVKRQPAAIAFPGTWSLPAGYCDAVEAPRAAALREAEEETGGRFNVGSLFGAYYYDDDPRGNGLLLVYEASLVGTYAASHTEPGSGVWVVESVETADLGFFPPDRLPKARCGGGHDRAIGEWQKRALDRWQPGSSMRYCPHCRHMLVERLAFERLRCVCPTCGYVHFRDPKVGVSLLVESEGRVLLVQRAVDPGVGLWSLPSGFVEWDEAPEAAAWRECKEETGLIAGDFRLLEAVHYADDFRGPGINLTYTAQVVGGTLQAGDDAQQARFWAPESLPGPDQIAFRNHDQALRRWAEASR